MTVQNMTIEGHSQLAQKYIQLDNMIYLVAGDAKTQMRSLSRLGMGRPILVDKDGNVVR